MKNKTLKTVYTLSISPGVTKRTPILDFHLHGIFDSVEKAEHHMSLDRSGHVIHEYFYIYAVIEEHYLNGQSMSRTVQWYEYNTSDRAWQKCDPPEGYEDSYGFI